MEADIVSKLSVLEKQPLDTQYLTFSKENDNMDEKDKLILDLRNQIASMLGSANTDVIVPKPCDGKQVQESIGVHSIDLTKGIYSYLLKFDK